MTLKVQIKKTIRNILPWKIYKIFSILKTNIKMIKENKTNHQFIKSEIDCTKKNRINIVFIVNEPFAWTSFDSVYKAAICSADVNTYILAQPKLTCDKKENCKNDAYDFCISFEPNTINAYDSKKNQWYDLKNLKPDYVFYTRPYNIHYYPDYRSNIVNSYAKVCLIQYGYSLSYGPVSDTVFNTDFIKNTDILFLDSKTRKRILRFEYFYYWICKRLQLVYLGYPRFDIILNKPNQLKADEKRKKILWLPRWTSGEEGNFDGNFLNYVYSFIKYAQENKNIELIIRPHPLMFDNYIKKGLITPEDLDKLEVYCSNSQNILLDRSSNYLLSLVSSDILVADLSSLVVEFYITGKPIIYCDKPTGFIKEGRIMNNSLYHAETWKSIELIINNLLNGVDPKKEKRKIGINKILPLNVGCIGRDILQYIIDDYLTK